jgi:hypothetical protein
MELMSISFKTGESGIRHPFVCPQTRGRCSHRSIVMWHRQPVLRLLAGQGSIYGTVRFAMVLCAREPAAERHIWASEPSQRFARSR